MEDLRDINSKGSRCPEQFIRGVRAMIVALKSWAIEKEVRRQKYNYDYTLENNNFLAFSVKQNGRGRSEPIPERVIVPKLLKDLSRELRHVEKNSNSTITSPPITMAQPPAIVSKVDKNPPKRIRRKPTRADFVDINEALSNFAAEEVSYYILITIRFILNF